MKKGKSSKQEEIKVEEVIEPVILSGSGEFILPDCSKYIGEWTENGGVKYRQGYGTLTTGLDVYSGAWISDSMVGIGEYRFGSGSVYKGNFLNNMFDGEGTYTFPDGATYFGTWKNNKMHGQGTYIDADGIETVGEFVNGLYRSGNTCLPVRHS